MRFLSLNILRKWTRRAVTNICLIKFVHNQCKTSELLLLRSQLSCSRLPIFSCLLDPGVLAFLKNYQTFWTGYLTAINSINGWTLFFNFLRIFPNWSDNYSRVRAGLASEISQRRTFIPSTFLNKLPNFVDCITISRKHHHNQVNEYVKHLVAWHVLLLD